MKVKIRRIGNSLGIILPKDTLTLLGLKEGNEIELGTKTKQINLTLGKRYDKLITPDFGGEIAENLNKLEGKKFKCDMCGVKSSLVNFRGYKHSGGLKDKKGVKWWVYYPCPNPECGYDWSIHKIEKRSIVKKS